MKTKQFHKQLKAIFNKMPYKLQSVHGSALPQNAPLCHSHMFLAGRACYMTHCYAGNQTEAYQTARNKMYAILYYDYNTRKEQLEEEYANHPTKREQVDSVLYSEFQERFREAYQELLRAELAIGSMRIPCIETSYQEDACIPSLYGDWDVNYSPTVTTLSGGDSVEKQSQILTDGALKPEQCNLITLCFAAPVKEQDIPVIYNLMCEAVKLCNQYLIEEFEEKKDDEKYRRRNDDDPEWF